MKVTSKCSQVNTFVGDRYTIHRPKVKHVIRMCESFATKNSDSLLPLVIDIYIFKHWEYTAGPFSRKVCALLFIYTCRWLRCSQLQDHYLYLLTFFKKVLIK